jgi:hypothetical protein
LRGSIVGVVIGLSLKFISHTIFYPIFQDYTGSAKRAEFICAIFVGLYCRIFCGKHLSRKSQKNFLAALAFVVTLSVIPGIRQLFISILRLPDANETTDIITYPISYAIICVLAGGIIETIAEMIDNNRKKNKL